MDMTLEELVLYQRYISEFQKKQNLKKLIESINEALDIINNTPEGLTLSDVNKHPYKKTHMVNMGIIEYTIRMDINNENKLNDLLNNKSNTSFNSKAVPLDKMVYLKLYESVSNVFLYYLGLKAKLNQALTRELARIKRIKEDLEKINNEDT